jgi:diguanylate cyclase (GGDEF)-like protein
MTRIDSLTGLLSVRYLTETLTQTLRSAQRRSEPVSIVYIDINDFKAINDAQGHQRGDEILRIVAAAIKRVSRIEDRCFRYGGDEFCLILPNCLEIHAQDIYITRLNTVIKQELEDVNLSVGIVQTGPNEFEEPNLLVNQADFRMYEAKKKFKAAEGTQFTCTLPD